MKPKLLYLKQVSYFQRAGGRTEGPVTVRGVCAVVVKIRGGEEGRNGLSGWEIRGKNF